MGEYDYGSINNNPTYAFNNMLAANNFGAQNVSNQLTNSFNNQAALANQSIGLLGSIGGAQEPGFYSPGSGRSSFSGTPLQPVSGGGGSAPMSSVFETGAPQIPYLYSGSIWGANNGEGIGQGAGMAPGYGGFNNPPVPTSPQQWYDNGGYDPFNPGTYAPSAQRNLGTGFSGMGGTPTGAGNAGNDPGGFSSYPKGQQSSIPFTWDNYFSQAQAPSQGGQGGGWEAEYLLANPDVAEAAKNSGQNVNAFAEHHYQQFGQNEGRGVFDANAYLLENPDVFAAGANPFQHYNQYGRNEGRAAPMSSAFDPETYKMLNPDVAAAGVDPLAHFLRFGQNEGRSGGFTGIRDAFDADAYRQLNPDVAAAGVDPFKHYMQYGQKEGREGAFDRYLMAAGGDYGQPTGVGGSGYGDGFGGYGHSWESPYPTPPGANINDPKSYWAQNDQPNSWETSRAPYTQSLANDPARMYDMAVRLYLELNGDPVGRQGIAEAMFNRNAARGLDPLSAKYFPKGQDYQNKYANATDWLRTQPELLGKIYGEIGRAAGGSNISQGATDWASDLPGYPVASEAAKYSTETWKSPNEGERFFRKDIENNITGPTAARQIQDWYRNMQSLQPQWPQ